MPKVLYTDPDGRYRLTEDPSGPGEPEIVGLEMSDPFDEEVEWTWVWELKRGGVIDLIRALVNSLDR